MGISSGPDIVEKDLVLHLDAIDTGSYARAGVIPPKSESIAGSWDDYGSNQANYTVVGDDGVIITGTGWVGEFTSQIPGGGGYFTVAFEYQSSSTATFLIDNDGANNNIFNQSGIVATTTKQIFTKTANCTVGGAEDRMYINKSSGSGSVIISNYRFYKSDSAGNSITWHDLVGTHTATKYGGTTYNSGGWFEFRNVIDDGDYEYFEMTMDNNVLRQGQELTGWSLEVWFRRQGDGTTPGGNENFVIGKTGWHGGIEQWASSTLNLRIHGVNAGETTDTSFGSITNNVWAHAVATYDSLYTRTYRDGVLANTTNWTPSWSFLYSSTLWRIGGYASNYYRANGDLAIIRAYTRELTAAEISQNFNAHKSRFGL